MGLAQQEEDIRILGVGLGCLLGQVAGFAEPSLSYAVWPFWKACWASVRAWARARVVAPVAPAITIAVNSTVLVTLRRDGKIASRRT